MHRRLAHVTTTVNQVREEIPDDRVEEFRRVLMDWFVANRREYSWRREDASSFEKVLAEVFLQRTTATNAASVLPQFIAKFPSWEAIAAAPDELLIEVLRPLGLWRRRVPALRSLAEELMRRGGVLPDNREELESLPGVGQYIANAILLSCFGQPEPLLDVNMARLLERYFGPRHRADIRYDPYLQSLSRRVVAAEDPEAINLAILDFAATVCRSRYPLHEECPLRASCRHANEVANVVKEA
jgi:A/G-specific adenine glycosylase